MSKIKYNRSFSYPAPLVYTDTLKPSSSMVQYFSCVPKAHVRHKRIVQSTTSQLISTILEALSLFRDESRMRNYTN